MGCLNSTLRGSTNAVGLHTPANGGILFHISDVHKVQNLNVESSCQCSVSREDIAIVGIGCRASGADNIQDFWLVLQNGECHVTDVPADRWNASAFLDPDPMAPGKAYVQKGAFIKDIYGFDNGLYGINDYEASQMDPQQCLLLDCTTMALEDAGITRKHISGSNTGVFVGSMNNDYGSTFTGKNTNMGSYTSTGISNTILASRLSFIFNLTGPCMVLDTACSASLIAIHQGCQAIRSGDCDMAISGGVNCMLTPDLFIKLCKARMISPTGLSRAFSDQADGYTRGEGCGIVILKRLTDAIRDGDNIRAIVCTGTNQDGHAVTPMTAPSGEQQKKLLHSVYSKFQVDVSEVDYVEAHGTGTPAGDPVEVNALGSFYRENGSLRERHIGSVKTNIGHTESAAGVLGLTKVLLMMEHNMIVPSLHCDVVNPKIDLKGHGFVIPQKAIPWTKPRKVAACNSFGFGGSNCHAVLRSYTAQVSKQTPRKRTGCIVCFSGKTQRALKDSLEDFYNDEEAPLLNIHDVSYTSTARRDHYPFRTTFIVEDMDDLMVPVKEKLTRNQWVAQTPSHLNIVFVFCGMGTAWDGMCRQLLDEHQIFRDKLLEVEKHLSTFVSWSLTERLQQENPTRDPVLAPIAIFACQVGLAAVWRSLGIQPSCVVGQSIGEIAAAHAAGCLSLPDAVKIIYHRSQLLAEVTGGAMMVVQNVELSKVRQVLSAMKDKASIALEYSPRACAISADPETMQSLKPLLVSQLKSTHKDMRLVDLDVCVAYHSPHVNTAADKLKKLISGVTPRAPLVPFLSTVTGHTVQDPVQSGHWVDNIKKPVLFHQAMVESVPNKTASSTIFLEIGPKPVLRAHMHDLFPDGQHTTVPSITTQSEMKCLYQSVATLYEHGLDIDWSSLPTHGNKVTAVPRYSFDKKYLKEETEQEVVLNTGCNPYRKNHLYVYPTEESTESFLLLLSPLTIPSVYQHVVLGKIVVPGALYAECGFALSRYIYTHTNVSVSVEFLQILPLKRDGSVGVQILPVDSSEEEAKEKQFVIQKNERQFAAIHLREVETKSRELFNLSTVRSKCTEEVNKANIYKSLRKYGFEYGRAFSLLEHAYRNSSECLVTLELHESVIYEMADTIIHPCILDCMLQSTVLVLGTNNKIAVKEMLPKSIGGLVVAGPMEPVMYVHTRLKFTGSNVFLFQIKLLSSEGHVIALLSDFKIQALTSQKEKTVPDMLAVHWEKIKDIPPDDPSNETQEIERKLLLINENTNIGKGSYISHLVYDSNNTTQNLKKELGTVLTSQTFEAIVFIVPTDEYFNKTADATQSKIVNLCLLLQSIINVLNDQSLHTPVFMCTFNAWPSPSGNQVRDVNPTATALWGLLRTVIDEHDYPDIVGVELHTAPDDLNSQSLQRLLDILMMDEDVADYPEVLITNDSIYVNQIVPIGSSLSLPKKRPSLMTKMKDVSGRAMLLSKRASSLSGLHAVSQEPSSFLGLRAGLRAQTFAVPSQTLFNTRVSSDHLLAKSMSYSSHYVVMALEVTGHATEGSGPELTSCGPLTVGPEVSISMDATLPTASIPGYQAGDLCKLVLFWNLVTGVPTKQFTILASANTKHLAELVKLLSCNATERMDADVNIVLIENIEAETSYYKTLLSLILVDVDTMSLIVRYWENTYALVSLSCLVTKDLQAYMACILSDTQLCLLDTQLMFQQCHLKSVIPNIREWIRKDTGLMSVVCQYLHFTDETDCVGGILGLLQFRSLNLPTLSVQVVNDKLFQRDGAYIVVGGLTGLGWLCVEFLAQNNAGYIAIINRRAPSSEQTSNINNLASEFGCMIRSFQADVSSVKPLQEVLQLLSNEWSQKGVLRGIFTGAAVVQDGFFPAMERSAFENVLTPKVQGTWNLHQLTKHLSLDYFVMHSSVASVLGNLGQANYAAGNAFLDGLAFHRRYCGLAAQSINWGPLDTGLLDNQDVLKQKLNSMGFHLTSQQEIREALWALMLLNWTQSVPVSLNRELFTNRFRGTTIKYLMKRYHYLLAGPSQSESNGQEFDMDNVDKFRFLPSPQRLQAYENFVQLLIARILSVDIARVTREVSLFDLGLDSVTGMMMISIIERNTSFKLSAVTVLTEVTVVSLARILDDFASEASQ